MQTSPQKKVLFLITKSNWGGAQRYVYDLATTLDPLLYQPLVAYGGDGVMAEKLQLAGIKRLAIKGLERDVHLWREGQAIIDIWRIIRRERPTVLHINSSKAGVYGALLGRLLRVPCVIFTSHGWAFNEARPLWQRFIIKILHWLTVLLAHRTIVVSQALKDQMRWPLASRKMQVVPLGRSVSDFKSRDDARQLIEMQVTDRAVGLVTHHNDPWVGTIAELHPVKQLPVAIDAIATLVHAIPNLRYIVIGEGSERETLIAQVERLGLEEHIFFIGTLPEAARFLPAFEAFLLPSRSEAAGYVVLEAGLAGVPVVASCVGGIPELVVDKHSGRLVSSGDSEATAAALREVLTVPELAARYRTALQATCSARSIARMTAETTSVYENIATKQFQAIGGNS